MASGTLSRRYTAGQRCLEQSTCVHHRSALRAHEPMSTTRQSVSAPDTMLGVDCRPRHRITRRSRSQTMFPWSLRHSKAWRRASSSLAGCNRDGWAPTHSRAISRYHCIAHRPLNQNAADWLRVARSSNRHRGVAVRRWNPVVPLSNRAVTATRRRSSELADVRRRAWSLSRPDAAGDPWTRCEPQFGVTVPSACRWCSRGRTVQHSSYRLHQHVRRREADRRANSCADVRHLDRLQSAPSVACRRTHRRTAGTGSSDRPPSPGRFPWPLRLLRCLRAPPAARFAPPAAARAAHPTGAANPAASARHRACPMRRGPKSGRSVTPGGNRDQRGDRRAVEPRTSERENESPHFSPP